MTEVRPNVGVVGTHVQQSLSPIMHNAAYREMGVDLHYGVFLLDEQASEDKRIEQLSAFLARQAESGVVGLSITMPFKEDILSTDCTVESDEVVQTIGAANTVSHPENGKWLVSNTDWLGGMSAIEESGADISDKAALVIGAGGTARAIAYGLASRGASRVAIANRTFANAVLLTEDLKQSFDQTRFSPYDLTGFTGDLGQKVIALMSDMDIIFNTTMMGQEGTAGEGGLPIGDSAIRRIKRGAVLGDVVYMPVDTPLLKAGSERNKLRLVNGTRMLLHQAVEQVRIFTGEDDVPVEAMNTALQAEILRRS